MNTTSHAHHMHKDVTRRNCVIAHATCLGFAFAFLMPLGAIVLRVARIHNLIWYHAAIMVVAYTLALAGLGLGVYIAIEPENQVNGLSSLIFLSLSPLYLYHIH